MNLVFQYKDTLKIKRVAYVRSIEFDLSTMHLFYWKSGVGEEEYQSIDLTKFQCFSANDDATATVQQNDSPNTKSSQCDHEWIGLYGHPAVFECKKCKLLRR